MLVNSMKHAVCIPLLCILAALAVAACGGGRVPAAHPAAAETHPAASTEKPTTSSTEPLPSKPELDPPELPPETGSGFQADTAGATDDGADGGPERKVLYIEQRFRWQARYLNEALKRDKQLAYQGFFFDAQTGWTQPTSSWTDEASQRPEALRWPMYADGEIVRTQEDFLALSYDVILLGDIDPASEFWRDSYLEWIEEWVKQGGGLIFAAGLTHNPVDFASKEAFRRLCPVDPDVPENAPLLNQEVVKYYGLTEAGQSHNVMRFSDDSERNMKLWGSESDGRFEPGQLRGAYTHATTGKAVEGATVLANVARNGQALDDAQPLIVVKEYGKGRVLWVGTDDTWLWREYVGDYYFYRFWQNGISWAAGDD